MSDDSSAPQPTPTNYQRTTGGNLMWQAPTPARLQELLPAYEILGILGQGGMGAVYKGRQKSLDRLVAIKILPPEAAENDMQFAERFKNEARTMAKMNHPAIVHVYDFGETAEGQLYIVMEFIDGTDVSKMIQSQGKLPEDYALSIAAHVCDALGYAHMQGIIHRDIKPANVLINMDGQVKVADFGLAKATDPSQMGLTKTNMAMGTPDFVSPEALMPGVPLDGRADLYAVGVMLYNMLTGSIPRGAFRLPSLTLKTDARFDQIILKAMEMDRENRYQTAQDLRRDLDVILTTPPAKTGGQTLPGPAAQSEKPLPKASGAPRHRPAGPPGKAAGTAASPPGKSPAENSSGLAWIIPTAISACIILGGAFYLRGKVSFTAEEEDAPPALPARSAPAQPSMAQTNLETKPAPAAPAPSPAPAIAAAPAQVGEVLTFGGHRYQLVLEKMSYWNADRTAKKMGGHLVFITSKEENEWVLKNVKLPPGNGDTFYTGGHLNGSDKSATFWQWLDGQPVDMSLWGGTGPDSGNGALAIVRGRWDDVNNSTPLCFLVEWDAAGTGKPPANLAVTSANAAPSPATVSAPTSRDADAPQKADPLILPADAINLLSGVNVERDSLFKPWRLEDGELKSPLQYDSQETILLSSASMPENYDLHYRITREREGYSLRFIFVQGNGGGYFNFDGTSRGDASIRGFPQTMSKESGKGKWFMGGVSRHVVIQVRESSVACLLDGEEILRAEGRALANGQLDTAFNPSGLQKPLAIGLSHSGGPLIVHEAKLVPFDTPIALARLSSISTQSPAGPTAGAPFENTPGMKLATVPPELIALDEQFQKLKAERVAEPFDAEVEKLNTGYIGGIDRAIADEKKAGRLDGVLALEAEKKLIQGGGLAKSPATTGTWQVPLPEDDEKTPSSLKTLRDIYRGQFAKLADTRDANLKALTEPLDKRLAQMETDFIRADRIADAKTIRTYRDALAKSSPGMQPIKTAVIPEPVPAVSSSAAPTYKDGYVNTLGMKFVMVKDTSVLICIHETRCKDWAAYAAEDPRAGGVFSPRAVDGFTVTERAEDHPVTNMNWEQAHQFCEWLSKKEGKYYRLPTDREWSYAAGVGSNEKWRKDSLPATITRDPDEFPWGKRWPPPKGSGNFSDESRKAKAPNKEARYLERYDDGFPTTAPVMSFAPNKLGIYDLSGNVWEWVEDYYNESKARALRGGGWETTDRGALLSSNRWERNPGNGYDYYGFRVVLVPDGRPLGAVEAQR